MLFQNKKNQDSRRDREEDDWDDLRDDEWEDSPEEDYDEEDGEEYEELRRKNQHEKRSHSSKNSGMMELRTWLVGRKPPCDILYNEASVSRKHCQIVETAEGYCISDLASANGTYVNGTRIYGEVPLYEGDEIQVGRVRFTFHDRMLRNAL